MSKYNSKKVELDNHIFDSQLEARYYQQLKWLQENEQILFFRLQPRYLLQEGFIKDGKTYRKIEYIADFEIHHLDGSIEVVDVKGAPPTEAFKLKKKLFDYKYPHKLSVVSYSKMDGGWILYEDLEKRRKERKKGKAVKKSGTKGDNRRRQSSMDKA
ncbi:DUF1064 domain-containing protein [Neobacillus sedimentimangrovi]|uniref:DUF1064 domain-containing protein n=1 Tax=Neobacillus sedimentimangrovi TaxID=2699460 RepID=A0ABS8QGB8_9BACI|nr:DUF1064 domain-containing protein [Neobacillus sedimentimangrovi]MCD4838152.1 DUF1064 domain-containing protein [Neobacillus sedimentimangrovi]